MEKITSFLKKYLGYISLVAFGLMFIYALGMATPAAIFKKHDETIDFYKPINPYNNLILILSIVGLLLSAFYMVLRNNKRVIYYASNFVSLSISLVFLLVSGILTIVSVSFYLNAFNEVLLREDFCEINDYLIKFNDGKGVNTNTPVFLLGYMLAGLLIFVSLLYFFVLVDGIKNRRRYEINKKNGISNPVTYKEVKGKNKKTSSNEENNETTTDERKEDK